MKNIFFLIFTFSLILSCSPKVTAPFINYEQSNNDNYGYSDDFPIRIGFNKDPGENIELCRIFISELRTQEMSKFYIDMRYSMNDPSYKKTFLDAYTLISEDNTDTLVLYFDIYHADSVYIPKGLFVDTTTHLNFDTSTYKK